MAECKITGAFKAPACDNKFLEPGIKKDRVYFANKSEVELVYTAGVVTNFTFDTYAGFYCATVHKDTALWSEELQVAQNSGSFYNQTATMRTINNTEDVRQNIEDFVDSDVIIVMQEKNGRFVVLGETGGLTMTENTAGSGATAGDDTGDLLTFTGTNNGKYSICFTTDEATTLALIESYVIG